MLIETRDRFRKFRWVSGSVLPALILLAAVAYLPIIYAVALGFYHRTAFDPAARWAGLDNFVWLLQDGALWASLGRSVVFTVGSVGLQLVWGLFFALLLNQAIRGQGVMRSLVILPYLLPTIVVGLVFKWILNPEYGIVNQVLMDLRPDRAADQLLRRAEHRHVLGDRRDRLAVRQLRGAADPGPAAGDQPQALRGRQGQRRRAGPLLLRRHVAQPSHHLAADRAVARHLDVQQVRASSGSSPQAARSRRPRPCRSTPIAWPSRTSTSAAPRRPARSCSWCWRSARSSTSAFFDPGREVEVGR